MPFGQGLGDRRDHVVDEHVGLRVVVGLAADHGDRADVVRLGAAGDPGARAGGAGGVAAAGDDVLQPVPPETTYSTRVVTAAPALPVTVTLSGTLPRTSSAIAPRATVAVLTTVVVTTGEIAE